MKLLVTGGHLTPALSLIDYARSMSDEIIFVGRKFANTKKSQESREKAEIENRGGIFYSIATVKIQRHQKIKSFMTILGILPAIVTSIRILKSHQPDVVVSFGGYVAVPVVIAAKLLHIPIFTHEQTHVVGLANRLIFKFADVIGLSWANTKGTIPKDKAVNVGNPIRYELKINAPKPTWVKSDLPIVYITGGSQGSKIINQVVSKLIPELTQKFLCIHQCGSPDDLEKLNQLKLTLAGKSKSNYVVRTWFSAHEVSWILSHAKIVIGRSGANTITEIIYKDVPAILIPLPHSGGNEQYHNAQALSDQNASILLPQSQLDSSRLKNDIYKLIENHQKYASNLAGLIKLLKSNPEENIHRILVSLHENHQK